METVIMPQAFDGVRVLELGQIYNGPYCGLLLAQLGADVIKIEPPGGEQLRFRSHQPVESHEFVMLNSNKRSVVLDLKTDAGRQALLDLVETADVRPKMTSSPSRSCASLVSYRMKRGASAAHPARCRPVRRTRLCYLRIRGSKSGHVF